MKLMNKDNFHSALRRAAAAAAAAAADDLSLILKEKIRRYNQDGQQFCAHMAVAVLAKQAVHCFVEHLNRSFHLCIHDGGIISRQ